MKMMKKVASLVLAGAMVLSMSVAAFAATGISADEQKILDAAPAKAAELGVSTEGPSYKSYYAQATSFLQKEDLSAAQVDGALKAMNDATAQAKAEMDKAGVAKLSELSTDTLSTVVSNCTKTVNDELKKVGVDVTVSVSVDGSASVKVGNDKVGSNENPIKQTGSDLSATAAVAVAVVGAVVACGVVAKKRDLFATEA